MKYWVTVYDLYKREILVEAENPDDAREKVSNGLNEGKPFFAEPEYSSTLEPKDWDVEESL